MVRKTEKLELFCNKYKEIPSLGFAHIKGEVTFKLWHEQFNEYPRVLDVHMNEMWRFSFLGVNNPLAFLTLKNQVMSEMEDNLIEASNEYELKKYFIHIRKKLDDIFFVSRCNLGDLNKVAFDLEHDDFKYPVSDETAKRVIFHTCLSQAKACFGCYLEIQSFVEEQEVLYLNNSESIGHIEINKFSNKTAHKILLLHELGIIDYLQKKYFNSNQTVRNGTDLAKLIANIINEPTKVETVRKNISGIVSKGKDNIITKPAVKEVKKCLAQFNIPLNRLKDKD